MSKERPPTINDAIRWTREVLIAHVKNRAECNQVGSASLAKDIETVSRVIRIQATHLAESSAALVSQSTNLLLDVIKATMANKPR